MSLTSWPKEWWGHWFFILNVVIAAIIEMVERVEHRHIADDEQD